MTGQRRRRRRRDRQHRLQALTPRAAALKQAMLDGRASQPCDRNPYAGDDYGLARAWRLGYRSMLEKPPSERP